MERRRQRLGHPCPPFSHGELGTVCEGSSGVGCVVEGDFNLGDGVIEVNGGSIEKGYYSNAVGRTSGYYTRLSFGIV